jgi:phosphatidylserine/phosphatidylglycerophosphate/cardiolipin synthase-like enzyme
MTPFASGNAITLLETGAEYFPALEAAIAQARREIHLETYIFADDPTGRRIAAALAAAARRGVRVRVLVDGFGAHNLVPPQRDILEPAGVHVLVFRPELSRFRLRRHRLRRMHRKLVVIDGETGILCDPDASAVARSLAVLLDDPGLAARLGANARIRAERLFSTSGMVAEHERLYRSLAQR